MGEQALEMSSFSLALPSCSSDGSVSITCHAVDLHMQHSTGSDLATPLPMS